MKKRITELREARLIVPPHANDGTQHWDNVEAVRALLIDGFGGYTETQGAGGYVMASGKTKTEPVVVFDIAMPLTHDAKKTLRAIALFVLRVQKQETVYVRYANGLIEFVGS